MADLTHAQNLCAKCYEPYSFPEDALSEMYQFQKTLQDEVFRRRNAELTLAGKTYMTASSLGPTNIFHFGCLIVEAAELEEAFDEMLATFGTPHFGNAVLEAKFEVIDMFHFLMNIFVYAGVSELSEQKFQQLYSAGRPVQEFSTIESVESVQTCLRSTLGELSILFGQIFNQLPFKNWKTYTEAEKSAFRPDGFGRLQANVLQEFFQLAKAAGISCQEFYSLYRSKNVENINRQKETGIYSQKPTASKGAAQRL